MSSALLLLGLVFVVQGCDGDGVTDPIAIGPYRMTFLLDASFQAPHGGQPIEIALVRSADGVVVTRRSGTVSATQDPSFSFSTSAVMQRGTAYEVHYWIDSNINGGALGVCDLPTIDHQWSVEFPSPTNDVVFTVSYNAALTEDVCSTFD